MARKTQMKRKKNPARRRDHVTLERAVNTAMLVGRMLCVVKTELHLQLPASEVAFHQRDLEQ